MLFYTKSKIYKVIGSFFSKENNFTEDLWNQEPNQRIDKFLINFFIDFKKLFRQKFSIILPETLLLILNWIIRIFALWWYLYKYIYLN
jgi:hypothetical protein